MEYENLLKLAQMNMQEKTLKTKCCKRGLCCPIDTLEKMPNKRDEFLSVLKRERTRKHPADINNKSFIIGNNYGISALENFDKYSNEQTLPKYGKRGKIFLEFMKLVDNFDKSKYLQDEQADKLEEKLETISKESGNIRKAKRTSLSSLIARIIFLVHRQHRKDQVVLKQEKYKEYLVKKTQANIKRTAKYSAIKNQMGTEAFNSMKKRDQHAKDVKNAKKMDENLDETSRFLEWRGTKGKYLDYKPQATFITPIFTEQGLVGSKELGYADFATLCDLVKYIIPKCVKSLFATTKKFANPQIHFKVDPADPQTQLYQYVAIRTNSHGNFIARLLRTKDLDHKTIFNITGYHKCPKTCDLYINVNHTTNSVSQSLPKQWSKFELWQGFGVMGNPGHSTKVKLLLKINPHNIDSFSFVKDGTRYVVRHTLMKSLQLSKQGLLDKLPDKLFQAVKLAKQAVDKQKKKRSQEAREKNTINNFRRKASGEINKSTKLKLTQLLAEGLIDEKTFKMGMSALE